MGWVYLLTLRQLSGRWRLIIMSALATFPVLMAVTMFWQTKITPSTADPAQQRIMLLMPLMFTVFFLWAPSGLVIYWFVSNLWAIGQQYFTSWLIGPAAVATVRPPAERQLKKVGAGRTSGADKS